MEKNEQDSISGGKQQERKAIRYNPRHNLWFLILLCIIAIVISSILLKRKQRTIRRERFDQLKPQESAAAYYQYFLHMLSLIRLEDNKSDTVREYVRKVRWRTNALFPGKSEFARISHDFERICYGEEPFDDDTRTRFRDAYQRLPSLCCKNAGRIRYLLLFFRT